MRCPPSLSRLAVASVCGVIILAGSARAFAASRGIAGSPTRATTGSAAGSPAPDRQRQDEDKLIYARVRDGAFTVDGMVAKLKLNYDVQGASFMYLFVPGVGTAVVSVAPEPDALVTTAGLHEDELSFIVDGHHFSLTGVSLASHGGNVPAQFYVRLDRAAWHLSRTPMVGFGDRAALPYEWPGALPPEPKDPGQEDEGEVILPVPSALLPVIAPAPPAPVPASSVVLHPVSLR